MPASEACAAVVGSSPNGFAAAITLARADCSVIVYEAKDTIGGDARTAELTLPGFLHDVCSAIHPPAAGSPFFAPCRWLSTASNGFIRTPPLPIRSTMALPPFRKARLQRPLKHFDDGACSDLIKTENVCVLGAADFLRLNQPSCNYYEYSP